MEKTYKDSIRNAMYAVYGPQPPIPVIGRLEDELELIDDGKLPERQLLAQAIRDAAGKAGCEADAALHDGASFVNWLAGVTTVNPLPPHYLCSSCHRTEFHYETRDSFDLPEKQCCGKPMLCFGHRIPAESAEALVTVTELRIRIPWPFAPDALRAMDEHLKQQGA